MEIFAELIKNLDKDLSLKESIANLAQKLEHIINAENTEFSYLLMYNDLVKVQKSIILSRINKSKAKLAPYAIQPLMMGRKKYSIPMGYLPYFFQKPQKNWAKHAGNISQVSLWFLNSRIDSVANWTYDIDRLPEVKKKMKEMIEEPNFVGSKHEFGIRWAKIALGLIPKIRHEQSLAQQIDKIENKILRKKKQIEANKKLLAKTIELKQLIDKSY
ncbi:unnamed protein product [Blepharisma stoltei]|uniref:Uncharacterized protein n=1 Tax=Blepharisma stoltei TaxID=1481888 RepID=A0AAU9IU52_9CILI|nr:unnamed protein product [Blepharisma stoltei]